MRKPQPLCPRIPRQLRAQLRRQVGLLRAPCRLREQAVRQQQISALRQRGQILRSIGVPGKGKALARTFQPIHQRRHGMPCRKGPHLHRAQRPRVAGTHRVQLHLRALLHLPPHGRAFILRAINRQRTEIRAPPCRHAGHAIDQRQYVAAMVAMPMAEHQRRQVLRRRHSRQPGQRAAAEV